jgi:vacuolar-type H+-ATPase subunit I/STV1
LGKYIFIFLLVFSTTAYAVGESLGDHTAELWQVMAGIIGILLTVLGFTFKGIVNRIKSIESKLTTIVSEDKCKALQGYCPHGNKLNSIASDTSSIKESIKEIVNTQNILRQDTLPKEYLSITNYDKAHLQLERSMEKNMSEIKDLIKSLKIELVERLNESKDER